MTGPNIQYTGTIYCNDARVTAPFQRTLHISPLPSNVKVADGIKPSPDAKASILTLDGHEKVLERGDYVLNDLGDLTVR
ncbi:hypothetical protein ABTE84_19345, partial [Acinetobacter baumannii]